MLRAGAVSSDRKWIVTDVRRYGRSPSQTSQALDWLTRADYWKTRIYPHPIRLCAYTPSVPDSLPISNHTHNRTHGTDGTRHALRLAVCSYPGPTHFLIKCDKEVGWGLGTSDRHDRHSLYSLFGAGAVEGCRYVTLWIREQKHGALWRGGHEPPASVHKTYIWYECRGLTCTPFTLTHPVGCTLAKGTTLRGDWKVPAIKLASFVCTSLDVNLQWHRSLLLWQCVLPICMLRLRWPAFDFSQLGTYVQLLSSKHFRWLRHDGV